MKKFIGQFIGAFEIKEIELVDEKTYFGKEKVLLKYHDESEAILPLEVVQQVATEKVSDATKLREARVVPVVRKLLAILAEADLTKEDLNYAVGPKLRFSLDDTFDRANQKLWGKESDKITLMDIEKVLKKDD